MGLSSQWNLGRKRHSWPASLIKVSNIEGWFLTSSCWLRSRAIQQSWLSIGQTGEHFARVSFCMSKPHSSSTVFNPFGQPSGSVIFWTFLRCSSQGLDAGMTVSCCFHCLPPSDLFISKGFSASGESDAWADDWSKINSACFPRWAASKICMALWTCSRICSASHQASPLAPGYMIARASFWISPFSSLVIRRPVRELMKSETWMSRPQPFFHSGCSSFHNL